MRLLPSTDKRWAVPWFGYGFAMALASSAAMAALLRDGRLPGWPFAAFLIAAPALAMLPLLALGSRLMRRMERERQRGEDELRVSRERFSTVVASAMDAIITLDESQRVLVFNQAAEQVFGVSAAEAIGKPLDRFLPEAQRQAHREHIRRFGETGRSARSMYAPAILTGVRASGEQFPIEATISLVQVAGQKLYTVILRDITERRLAEETLRQSEGRFRSIFEQAAIGIGEVDFEGRLLMANPALCRMLGYDENKMEGMSLAQVIHPDDYSRELELFEKMLAEGCSSYDIEKRYVHRDGSAVWVHSTTALVRGGDGKPLYRLVVVEDISARKRAEEQLAQALKMEAIGRLAGGVAHDFNTLLNVMLGYSELLLSEIAEDDPRHDWAAQIRRSGQAGALLTRQLLAFSRKQAIAGQVMDVCELLGQMTPILKRLLRDDIQLGVHCHPGSCLVKIDPGQFQQLVLNLVINASDAMANGGRLTVELRGQQVDAGFARQHSGLAPGSYAMLRVSDTGTGMSQATIARVFEPFFTTKEPSKGTGLGLATVHGIVRRNGGDIWVQSELGAGSVFQALLPIAERLPAETAELSPPLAAAGGGETILLVEDSAALRELTRVILQRDGYRVLEAEDGVAALEVARNYQGAIDLVLSDVVMPRMRGPAMAAELLGQRPGTAVVFLSGYSEEVLSQGAGIAGFNLVEKPYTAESLLKAIARALDEGRRGSILFRNAGSRT